MKRHLIIFIALILLASCAPATYRLYTTPPVTPGEQITIMTKYDNKAFLLSVNGEKVSGLREIIVEVPPGPVVIEPMYNDNAGNSSITAYPETYNLTPGHTYILGARIGEVRDEATRYSRGTTDLFFYMIDQMTKETIYPVSIGNAAPITPEITAPTSPVANNNPFITTESGYLSGPGKSYTFTVNAGDVTYLEVPFTYPAGSVDFWVKVVGQDGRTVLGDFDLDNGSVIQLNSGGTYYLTIYSKSGSGKWSATYNLYPAEAKKFGITESGYLSGPGKSYTFTVNAGDVTYLEVPFTYPVGPVEFWVKVVRQDGRTVLGDYNLDNGYMIQLSGGGTFYLTIYSKMGAGKWSATY